MNSSYFPAGPEAAPTQTLQPVAGSSSTGLSSASIGLITVFLSLFGLAALVVVVYRIRRRRTISKIADVDEQPLEKAAIGDVEALSAVRPVIPVAPVRDVRWTPQIRSISGPAPVERSRTTHARSPPPSKFSKPLDLFSDPHPKSAPAHALSFPQDEVLYPEKNLRGDMSPAVTPQALSVSGMQTRSLGRSGFVSKS